MNRKSGNKSRNYLKATIELRNDEDPPPLNLYRNPETLWHEVLGEESQAKVTIHDVVDVLSKNNDRLTQKNLIEKLKSKTGASDRTIKNAITEAKRVKRVKSVTRSGKGGPKEVYLPGH